LLDNTFKGIVHRDLTGVETRLKRSALMNYNVAKFAILIFKGTLSREEHRTDFSVLTTIELNLLAGSQNPANDSLRTMILEI
jgi:hypothetical protein